MELIGNNLNGAWPSDLVKRADSDELERVDLAVAYVSKMDEIFDLVAKRRVPMNLYALADGSGVPSSEVVNRFVGSSSTAMRLFLTRDFYHPKIVWFRGVGAYIGSANLSDKAWFRNDECGIWLSHFELEELNWTDQLASMFEAIAENCREANSDDARALDRLRALRRNLDGSEDERNFRAEVKKALAGIPGDRSRAESGGRRESGGAARRAFVRQWEEGLTILRKISKLFEAQRDKWPKWVDQKASPSIVQDQATEWWWSVRFRRTGQSRREMAEAHARNKENPDSALAELFARWSEFDPGNDDKWSHFVNESPRELYDLLQLERLAQKSEADLARTLVLCHASREHGRQIRKSELGLNEEDETAREDRIRVWASLLAKERSQSGRDIWDVIEFVLWGDKTSTGSANAAERLWAASNDPERKLPHMGPHILGELIGYARPGEYPPRNNRVSKTLYALGYESITYS